jgi:hypothetical protein
MAATGAVVLIVEQRARVVLAISDRTHVLAGGELRMEGPPAELAGSPSFLGGGQGSAVPSAGAESGGLACAAQRGRSNSPALTPRTKASHSARVYRKTGPEGSFESRSMITSRCCATSTHSPPPQKLARCQTVPERLGFVAGIVDCPFLMYRSPFSLDWPRGFVPGITMRSRVLAK